MGVSMKRPVSCCDSVATGQKANELDLLHLKGEQHYYEVRTQFDHIHLACFQCGRIEEFSSPLFDELKAEISRQKGFQIQVVRLEVGGRCSSCRDSIHHREDRKGEARSGNGRANRLNK